MAQFDPDGPGLEPRWNWLAQLAEEDWAVSDSLISAELVSALANDAQRLHAEGALTPAGVGRADDFLLTPQVRRDKTLWLDRDVAVQGRFLDLMESVRIAVNRELFMGLFAYEAHYAAYEKGDFYRRHMDAFRGARNRVLSTVLYLNEDWREDDGGALTIWRNDEEGAPISAQILPEAGRCVFFLSENIPHEVQAAQRTRYSIAGWFRVNDRLGAPILQAPGPVATTLD